MLTTFLTIALLAVAGILLALVALLGLGFWALKRQGTKPAYATWLTDEPIVKLLASVGLASATTGHLTPYRRVSAKTADYTIDPAVDPCGTTFTNRGAAGAVNFTLPAAGARLAGHFYRFKGHADQNIVVVAAVADTLVALNDAAADSLALSTAGQKIGGEIEAFCDGTSWFASVISVGHTGTVAT